MNILSKFDSDPRFDRLARRRNNFREMIEHLLEYTGGFNPAYIIETGSAWDKNNWEGQGQSTLIWDWLIGETKKNLKAISIDINPVSTENAKSQTSYVEYITGDSVLALNQMSPAILKNCRLLYLDSFDWSEQDNLRSSMHHMSELAACWRFLPEGCLVVVDDRHGNFKGKHWLVEIFMSDYLKAPIVFKNHQIGWTKPPNNPSREDDFSIIF